MFTGSSGSICTTTAATTTRTATTKTIIPTIHTTTTATIATISIPVLVIICVLAVMMIVRARSKRGSGETNPSAIPLIPPDAVTMPDADPVFTSATTETNPGAAAMEEQSSSADPVFTSQTDSTNFSNLARSGDQHEQPHQESNPLWWVKPHPGASADILVVDHIKTNRMVVTLAAKKSGLTFHLAANGLQALDRMRRNTYSMVFMDREMPIMDGVVATEQARANGYTLPIVMTSEGTLEPQERLELKRRGITAFLSTTSAPAILHAMKMLRDMKETL